MKVPCYRWDFFHQISFMDATGTNLALVAAGNTEAVLDVESTS